MTASVDIAAKNEKILRQIAVAVSRSQGQFKLMRLRCDYQQEQRQWAERLQSLCRTDYSLTLPVLDLKPDDTKLFSQIQDFITAQATPPGGIQVMGFEALSDRPNTLKSLNLIRENLNQLALPLLWWLDEGSLIDLMHYANDIHSWSTSKQFLTSDRVLEQIITSYTDRLRNALNPNREISNREISDQWVGERAIWSASDRFELQILEREVQAGEANCFTPEVQANFHFVVGRSAYEAGRWQQAKNHWQSSLELNPNPWLLFHLGLAVLKLGEQDHALRAEAETLLDRSCEALPQLDGCEAIVLLRGWQRSFPSVDVRDLSPENLEQAITALDSIAEFDRVGFPQLHCQALKRLGDLHYQRQHYDRAFDLQQKRQEVERLYGLRAFIGAGRLKGEVADRFGGNLVPEIEQSGRGDDVRELLERIGGTTHRMIVIQGPSGVGKSSLVNAGLIPALGQVMMGGQHCFPVVVRRYKDWVKELNPPLTPPRRGMESISPSGEGAGGVGQIVAMLEEQTRLNLRPVLIFDQFEEFFFAHPTLGAQRQFFEFLGQILSNPQLVTTKIVFSLRRDYLHLLLVCKKSFQDLNVAQLNKDSEEEQSILINLDILSDHVLYPIDNLTQEYTRQVIETLTTNAHFPLEPALVERLVKDLNGEDGVRPIELQIVGSQLQDDGIQALAVYEAMGENPKQTLVQNYLQSVVRACGPEQEKLADLVLYFLTDEQGTRPLQTRPEILKAVDIVAREQGWDEETLEAKLSLVLKIFVGSGLVMLLPAQPLDQYQLVHDYLSAFIRSTRESRFEELVGQLKLIAHELAMTQQELAEAKKKSSERQRAAAQLAVQNAKEKSLEELNMTQRELAEVQKRSEQELANVLRGKFKSYLSHFLSPLDDFSALEVNTMVVSTITGTKFNAFNAYILIYKQCLEIERAIEHPGRECQVPPNLWPDYLKLLHQLRLAYRCCSDTLTDGDNQLPDPDNPREFVKLAGLLTEEPSFVRTLRKLHELKLALDSTDITSEQKDLIYAQTTIQLDGDIINRYHKNLFNSNNLLQSDVILKIHHQGVETGRKQWQQLAQFVFDIFGEWFSSS